MAIVTLPVIYFSAVGAVMLFLYLRGVLTFLYLTTKIPQSSIWKLLTVHAPEVMSPLSLTHISHICETCADFSYKPFGTWFMTGNFAVVVSDPDTFQEVYENKHLANKPDQVYGTFADYGGRVLIAINDKLWRRHRKMVSLAMHKSLLDANMHIVFERAANLVEEVRAKANGRTFDIGELLDESLFDLQARFFSSNDVVYPNVGQKAKAHAHISTMAILSLVNPVYHWFSLRLHGPTRETEKMTRDAIAESKALCGRDFQDIRIRLKHNPPRNARECMVQVAEANGIVDDDEIAEEIFHLVAAASEPVATATKAAILMLALHQDVQQRVLDELRGVLGENSQPSTKDLDRMVYLDLVIKESLRLFPSGWVIQRKVNEETKLGGLTIPKGALVILNVLALHRNQNVFEDSLKFIPERFLPQHSETRHPYAYIPFSSGKRSCLGQVHAFNVMKSLLSCFMRVYRILPGDGLNSVSDVKISSQTTLYINETPIKLIPHDKVYD